jgi:hypothetical protein
MSSNQTLASHKPAPHRQSESSFGTKNSVHFAQGRRSISEELQTQLAIHDVERIAREWQFVSVGFLPLERCAGPRVLSIRSIARRSTFRDLGQRRPLHRSDRCALRRYAQQFQYRRRHRPRARLDAGGASSTSIGAHLPNTAGTSSRSCTSGALPATCHCPC